MNGGSTDMCNDILKNLLYKQKTLIVANIAPERAGQGNAEGIAQNRGRVAAQHFKLYGRSPLFLPHMMIQYLLDS